MVPKRLLAALFGVAMALGPLVVGTPAQAKPVGEPQAIIGGRQATENYPFLVNLPTGCTGMLIKADWVATAQHCATPASVRVGSINRTSGGTVARVAGAFIKPGVDLKLLRLAAPVNHAPIVIAPAPALINNVVRLIGWGQTCPLAGCGGIPTVARERDQLVTFENRCNDGFIDGFNEMCIQAGVCFGDSGGPAVRLQDDGRWFVHGLFSRITVPGNCDSHNIAVDMSQQVQWISDTVGGGLPT